MLILLKIILEKSSCDKKFLCSFQKKFRSHCGRNSRGLFLMKNQPILAKVINKFVLKSDMYVI